MRERVLWREKETVDLKRGGCWVNGSGRMAVGKVEKIGERGRGKRIEN